MLYSKSDSKIILSLWVSFQDSPIWCFQSSNYGPIELEKLNLSLKLIHRIASWDKKYQDTFDPEYPPNSREFSEQESLEFNEEGLRLANELAKEIGDKYKIEYHLLSYDAPTKIIEIN